MSCHYYPACLPASPNPRSRQAHRSIYTHHTPSRLYKRIPNPLPKQPIGSWASPIWEPGCVYWRFHATQNERHVQECAALDQNFRAPKPVLLWRPSHPTPTT
ncbi:hypothetical protein LINGRAHAP2_LOCUS15314 [Linum grandiflorum]